MLALAILCGLAAAAPTDLPPAPAMRVLRFAWPAHGSALVKLVDERRVGDLSRSSTISMRLELSADPASEGLLVHVSDRKTVSGTARSLESLDPAVVGIEVARVLAQATPDFVVSSGGDFVEARNLDTALHAVLEACGFPDEPPGIRAFRDLLEAYAAEDWSLWVGSWRGLSLAPGESMMRETEVPFHGVPTKVRVTRRGLAPPGTPGRLRLQSTTEYPTEAVRKYTGGFLLDMAVEAKELGEDPVVNIRFLDKAKYSPMTETVTIELEAATMRPILVERVRTFSAAAGRHSVDGIERRVHTFTWSDP